jgi:rhodanese-related sulfurtransferase
MKTIRFLLPLFFLLAFVSLALAQSELEPGGAALIQPADLAKMLDSTVHNRPLVLSVGPRMLYQQAHIAGAEYIGAGSTPAGIDALRARLKSLPKTTTIVLYCGCCPWGHCPNIRPAYKEVTAMGFKNVKALYIANNFGADWVDKGYPTTKGQ